MIFILVNLMKCPQCNKKLKILEEYNKCRCGGVYCGNHWFSEKHNCTFDYKVLGQEQLKKQNVKVVAVKIDKI